MEITRPPCSNRTAAGGSLQGCPADPLEYLGLPGKGGFARVDLLSDFLVGFDMIPIIKLKRVGKGKSYRIAPTIEEIPVLSGGYQDTTQYTLEVCPAWACERCVLVGTIGANLWRGSALPPRADTR